MVVTKTNSNLDEVKPDFDFVSHIGDLLISLNTQRQSNILCDVVLVIGDDELPAHKGVLAANSKYFLAMFTADLAEKTMKKIKIIGISTSAMKQILDFIYTGVVNVTEDNVRELLQASSFLLMNGVQKICSNFLQKKLVVKNCLAILSLADEFCCEALYRCCINFLFQNFLKVSQTRDFAKLKGESIKKMLLSDDLNIEKEEDLLHVVINWIKHDLETRKHLLPVLMKSIRVKFIQTPLDENAAPFDGLPNTIVNEIIQFCKNSLSTAAPRKSYSKVEVILTAGGCSTSRILKQSYCYIPGSDKWTAIGELNVPRWRLGLVRAKSTIYAVGGLAEVVSPHEDPPFIERYNPITDSWEVVKTVLPFSVDRDYYGTAVFSNHFLVVGGIDPGSVLAEREVISFNLGMMSHAYTKLAPMLVPRAGHCLVTSERFLYVIGGAQTDNIDAPLSMNTVERYNAKTDSWEFLPSMSENRCYASAVWCEGKLYVIGGYNGRDVLSCGEMYDPDMNCWLPITLMSTPRMKSGIAVHGGQIYVMGGVSDLRQNILNSVERYNPSDKRWTVLSQMPTGASDFQCCVTEVPYKSVASILLD